MKPPPGKTGTAKTRIRKSKTQQPLRRLRIWYFQCRTVRQTRVPAHPRHPSRCPRRQPFIRRRVEIHHPFRQALPFGLRRRPQNRRSGKTKSRANAITPTERKRSSENHTLGFSDDLLYIFKSACLLSNQIKLLFQILHQLVIQFQGLRQSA